MIVRIELEGTEQIEEAQAVLDEIRHKMESDYPEITKYEVV